MALHCLYKNLGETPLETILRFKKENSDFAQSKMTYAGRLDPMAEGLLLVLSDDDVKDKEKYLGLNKTYEFEVLWGVKTDTGDVLGVVVNSDECKVEKTEIEKYLESSVGTFKQKYPNYSSKTVGGKSLWQLSREGEEDFESPDHEVEIFSTKHLERYKVSKADLIEKIRSRVSLVSGDFRQKDVISGWENVLEAKGEDFVIDKIEVEVSSGFYIRQFVLDLGTELNTSAVTFHIKRTKVGEFSLLQN